MRSQHCPTKNRIAEKLIGVGAALLLLPALSLAQTAITGWVLNTTDAADTSAYSSTVNFQNTSMDLTSITAGTTQVVGSVATSAFVRRSASTNNNSSVWEIRGVSVNTLRGQDTSSSTLDQTLLNGNVLMGAGDLFTNTGGSGSANSNVERVDFYWAGGFSAVSSDGFAVFDRGSNEGFQIAVITGWDTVTNRATAYSGISLDIAPSSYGADLAASFDANSTVLRFNNGDNLSTLASNSTGGGKVGIGGVFITFADLGIAQGTTVYGYSLMATDTTNNVADLVDWNNATFYPTSTTDTIGGIDLVANGRRFVPEPATYGAILLFFTVAVVAVRRRQLAVPVAAGVRG